MAELSDLDVVFLEDLVDSLFHHEGGAGTVGAAGEHFLVVKFCHFFISPFLKCGEAGGSGLTGVLSFSLFWLSLLQCAQHTHRSLP